MASKEYRGLLDLKEKIKKLFLISYSTLKTAVVYIYLPLDWFLLVYDREVRETRETRA